MNAHSSEPPFTGSPRRPNETSPQSVAAALRPFGRKREDVDLNFNTRDHLRLATEILSRCLLNPALTEPGRIWDLPVSRRIEYLLQLASTDHDFAAHLSLDCPRAECRQRSEINLPIADLSALQARVEEQEFLEWQHETRQFRFRRPTGNDQIAWRRMNFTDSAEARATMCSSLATDNAEPCPSELVDAVESKFEEFDPLTAFFIRVCCPHCNAETNFPVDLEALALGELERIQHQLLRDIHQLAVTYHWNETEIFSLTPKRRAHYLKLIEEAAR